VSAADPGRRLDWRPAATAGWTSHREGKHARSMERNDLRADPDAGSGQPQSPRDGVHELRSLGLLGAEVLGVRRREGHRGHRQRRGGTRSGGRGQSLPRTPELAGGAISSRHRWSESPTSARGRLRSTVRAAVPRGSIPSVAIVSGPDDECLGRLGKPVTTRHAHAAPVAVDDDESIACSSCAASAPCRGRARHRHAVRLWTAWRMRERPEARPERRRSQGLQAAVVAPTTGLPAGSPTVPLRRSGIGPSLAMLL